MRKSLLAAMLVFPLAAGGCSYQVVRGGQLNRSRFEQIRERLSATRGLTFLQPVPVSIVTPTQVRAYLSEELHQELAPHELQTLTRVYSRLGLLEENDDLERALLDLYQDQVAGFYDPQTKNLFLVTQALRGELLIRMASALLRRDLAGEMFLAHELTHALQDQHFAIGEHLKEVKQDDRSLARRAVYEGDATLAGFAALAGGLDQDTLDRIVDKLKEVPAELDRRYPGIPQVLRAAVAFQYVQGTDLVADAYRAGGWQAVNALVADPPASTEQVMHPHPSSRASDAPAEIDLSRFSAGRDWHVAEENTMGELMVLTLFRQYLPAAEAAEAARGWGGDRVAAYEKDDELCVIWLSLWDTDDDAAEFFAALGAVMADRHPQARTAPLATTAVQMSAGGSYYIERRDAEVLLIDHAPAGDLAGTASRVWGASPVRPPALKPASDRPR